MGRSTSRDSAVYVPGAPPRTRTPAGGYGLMLAMLGCFLLGLAAAAQYVAWGFGFHPNLGMPWLILPAGSGVVLRGGAVLLAGLCVPLYVLGFAFARLRAFRRWLPALLVLGVLGGGLGLCSGVSGPVPVYAPVRFLGWGITYGSFGEASPYFDLFTRGLLAGSGVFALAAVAVLAARQPARVLTNTGSHGTAGWSDGKDLAVPKPRRALKGRARLRGEFASGVLVGRGLSVGSSSKNGDLLRYAGEGHLVTVAPTRSGKGTGGVIPNLLTYPGSIVVTDPKGENYAVTARHRSRMLGNTVRALDPFDQLGVMQRQVGQGTSLERSRAMEVVRATYNPMDLIDPYGDDWLECASLLADMLVLPPQGRGGEEVFWNEEAKGLLTGLILYVATSELDEALRPTERRTLARVRELLTLPRADFKRLMQAMEASPLCGGLVRRAASRYLQKEDRERSGVVSTAQSHTHFLDSPRMAEVMARSSVDLAQMKRKPTTLYLVLPAHYLDTYSRWLRLVIACALHELARAPSHLSGGGEQRRVLFLLDEFANLGRMNPVLRAVSLMAGYGVSIWTFLQDLSQLKGTYPDRWGTFLANADVLQAFGTNDYDTARYLSDLAGEATVFVETASQNLSRSRGKHASRSQAAGQSYAERGRKLLTPDEVRRLPGTEQLLFVKGMRPVRAGKINYLVDLEFRQRGRAGGSPLFDENPMHLALARSGEERTVGGSLVPVEGEGLSPPVRGPGVWVDSTELRSAPPVSGPAPEFSLGLEDPDLPRWLRDGG